MGGVQGMTAVLEAIGMEKRFPVKQQMLLRRRDTFQALQGIDLALYSGQTLHWGSRCSSCHESWACNIS